jgi:hypothetical protein
VEVRFTIEEQRETWRVVHRPVEPSAEHREASSRQIDQALVSRVVSAPRVNRFVVARGRGSRPAVVSVRAGRNVGVGEVTERVVEAHG